MICCARESASESINLRPTSLMFQPGAPEARGQLTPRRACYGGCGGSLVPFRQKSKIAPATIDNKRLCYGLGFSSQKSGIEFFQYPETEKNGDAAVDDGISSTVLEDRQTHVNSHPIGPLQLRGDVTYWRERRRIDLDPNIMYLNSIELLYTGYLALHVACLAPPRVKPSRLRYKANFLLKRWSHVNQMKKKHDNVITETGSRK
ncbi:hypothetical protein GQR58_026165 [Nymphon striatum]|nr:hypothetical protein GQR58_026165 [Nymphon striatum]